MNIHASNLVFIAVGGAVGAVARYLISGWTQRGGTTFPVGTLTVNVLGCLIIGLLYAGLAWFDARFGTRAVAVRQAVFIGFLGALTTFSTFGLETFELINDRQFARAALNVLASNGLCLLAVLIGYRVGERVWGVS